MCGPYLPAVCSLSYEALWLWPMCLPYGTIGNRGHRERAREAHVDPDSKSCSFSLFVRMSCVDKNAGQSSYFGEDMCWNACNACRHQREQIATAMLQASAIKSRENYVDD